MSKMWNNFLYQRREDRARNIKELPGGTGLKSRRLLSVSSYLVTPGGWTSQKRL
jgi:hypothetical protein